MHRLATLADLDAVYAIYMHEEVVPYLGYDPMPREDFVKVLSDLVAGHSFFVVEVAGAVQGFYRATRHPGRARHAAYLGTFAVAPEARGTGLARSIIETALSRLNAEGVTRVELTLEADNHRALKFYTKLGFELEGTMRSALSLIHI
jgi:ribosomal protein S18 acetylase RimI-like enzyme